MKLLLIKRITYLFLIAVTACAWIFTLYHNSDIPNSVKNGFNRKIKNDLDLQPDYFKNIQSSSCYFAGKSGSHNFLADAERTAWILQLDNKCTNLHEYKILLPSHPSIEYRVDSPFVYGSSFKDSIVIITTLNNAGGNGAFKSYNIPLRYTLFCPLLRGSIVFRTIDTMFRQNSLAKYIPIVAQSTINRLLEKQGDGFFSTDGSFSFDPVFHILVYVYYYRNQFICMDTNIQLKYRAQTIDTNKFAKLNIQNFEKSNLYTFVKPPVRINQKATTCNGHLYICSGLLSDNEDRQAFSKSSVIDVYELSYGHYQMSFYIPAFDGYKIRDFILKNQSLFALQGPFIVHYPLPFNP